ncbi:MAG: calcium/sodium antiporter [Lachnospiraceae bacterium]|jgi:cation:H+ antiporter|nr:calcium/sodium antiporter [Lachnospiraceae bacterium]MBR4606109.1 calcium/sodium antiporter [Lachnospiraceae bacterium]MBR6151462.1 calcium/sodium antiporter [Lachnospiraceae bacterium]
MQLAINIGLLVLGFVLLMKGADWFVDGAASIADRLGIPQLVIGLTIVAMGTSLPEAAVSISAAMKGSAAITIGNVLGSNILNVLVILGLTSVICVIPVQKSTVRYEIPFTILVTVVMAALGLMDHVVNRLEGGILWAFMILYLLYLLKMAKNGNASEEEETDKKKKPIWLLILMIIVGAVMIVKGSDFTVDAASAIAASFGMEERFIGLTIVALGTSLPELVTSVTAGIKGKPDIAVGNIVGSNIFNILFVAGTTALITPVTYASNFFIDSVAAIASAVLLFLCVVKNHRLGRLGGFLMLIAYTGYFVYLLQPSFLQELL